MTIIEKLFDKKPSDKELSCFIADMISMKGYHNMDLCMMKSIIPSIFNLEYMIRKKINKGYFMEKYLIEILNNYKIKKTNIRFENSFLYKFLKKSKNGKLNKKT